MRPTSHEFLEGTGSICLIIAIKRSAYAAGRRKRTHETYCFIRCWNSIGFQGVLFDAADFENGTPVYHSKCFECISSQLHDRHGHGGAKKIAKRLLFRYLSKGGLTVIGIKPFNKYEFFVVNAIELKGKAGCLLALSLTAFHCANRFQKNHYSAIKYIAAIGRLSTIESAGWFGAL